MDVEEGQDAGVKIMTNPLDIHPKIVHLELALNEELLKNCTPNNSSRAFHDIGRCLPRLEGFKLTFTPNFFNPNNSNYRHVRAILEQVVPTVTSLELGDRSLLGELQGFARSFPNIIKLRLNLKNFPNGEFNVDPHPLRELLTAFRLLGEVTVTSNRVVEIIKLKYGDGVPYYEGRGDIIMM